MNAVAFALPEIQKEVEQMKRGIENSVMAEVHSGSLTPEKALNKWIEWTAVHRLVQRFNQQITMQQVKENK